MDTTVVGVPVSEDHKQLVAQSVESSQELHLTTAEEEVHQAQTVFSEMIDQTCSHDPTSSGNIFQQTHTPPSSLAYLCCSIVPKPEILKHEFPHHLFNYEDRDGMKYAFQVLDRRTNRLIYEQMPLYHRYGMRMLFSGPVQRELLHTSAIRNFFARESIRLGDAFDEPKSRKHIPAFVKMYQIDLNELLEPNISMYFTFNEFFYRKLKTDARPIDERDTSSIIVSAADCRLILFDNISDATRIWIKGHQFSLRCLFQDDKLAREFDDGSIAVFRLAPADYHRFHSPIKGVIGEHVKKITGTYYTVNPVAIKEELDVLTLNQRTVLTIESECFERVVFVAIGALLVGSVNLTVQAKQAIEKGDELGYFAYGGSTIVVVFKAGMVKWDDDLRHNSNNSMETLIRMGERIGQRRSEEQRHEYLLNTPKTNKKDSTISQLLSYFPMNNMK